MTRHLMLKLAPLAVALLAGVGWTSNATVGPPWISLEIPANPLDPTTRDAVALVHVYHHELPAGYSVAGTAEGLVDGERRTIDLELTRTSRPSVYALSQSWPDEGDWVLKIGITQGAEAALLVELGPDGGIVPGRYFNQPVSMVALRSVQVVSGPVDQDRIEKALVRLSKRSTD